MTNIFELHKLVVSVRPYLATVKFISDLIKIQLESISTACVIGIIAKSEQLSFSLDFDSFKHHRNKSNPFCRLNRLNTGKRFN